MKKILFSILVLTGMCLTSNAQKIKWDGVSDVEWQVKRCYVRNDRCILDLLVVNDGSKDISSFMRGRWLDKQYTIAYDDEGNNYEYYEMGQAPNKHIIGAETTINGQNGKSGSLRFELPVGVSAKARIVLNDFDEYASKLTLVKLMFGLELANGGYATLEIREIPVTRD